MPLDVRQEDHMDRQGLGECAERIEKAIGPTLATELTYDSKAAGTVMQWLLLTMLPFHISTSLCPGCLNLLNSLPLE